MPSRKKKKSSPPQQNMQADLADASVSNDFPRASFLRRVAAMIYDLLAAVAVAMVAAMVVIVTLIILFENGVLDKQGVEHSSEIIRHSFVYRTIVQVWVAGWVIGFFVWFWRNGGQTIGMRAWRMRLFSTNDAPMGYGRAFLRMIYSLGGLGSLLVLFDIKYKQSLQDRLAHTEILVLTKEANDHKSW